MSKVTLYIVGVIIMLILVAITMFVFSYFLEYSIDTFQAWVMAMIYSIIIFKADKEYHNE